MLLIFQSLHPLSIASHNAARFGHHEVCLDFGKIGIPAMVSSAFAPTSPYAAISQRFEMKSWENTMRSAAVFI